MVWLLDIFCIIIGYVRVHYIAFDIFFFVSQSIKDLDMTYRESFTAIFLYTSLYIILVFLIIKQTV